MIEQKHMDIIHALVSKAKLDGNAEEAEALKLAWVSMRLSIELLPKQKIAA